MNNYPDDIYTDADLSIEERTELNRLHHQKIVAKGQRLVDITAATDQYWIVEEGLLRSYVVSAEGNDITTNFFSAGQVALEFSGFFLRKPALESIEVITESLLWQVDRKDFESYMKRHGALGSWGRHWMVNHLVSRQQFHLTLHTLSARERYEQLVLERPHILQLSPLKHIATYLGITDSTLSRLRKQTD